MVEAAFFIELIKYVGFPALIFIIWYLTHKSSMGIFNQILEAFKEDTKRTYESLKDMLQANQLTLSALVRIEQKIDHNTFCPLVRNIASKDDGKDV
jgi:ATP/maltotriose-dependent transcriptional regulator MalT